MPLDIARTGALVFGRIYQDAEGAEVRSRLGGGQASIVHATLIDQKIEADRRGPTAPKILLPTRPFLAFRRGAVPTTQRVLSIFMGTWYIYDDPGAAYWRIDEIASLIPLAYRARKLDQSSGGVIGGVEVGDVGPQLPDVVLGLLSSSIRVSLLAG
jgi:hypothetical protein